MIYLLTLGWPWFAGAGALGALIGFFTFRLDSNARFSGGWIIVAGATLLAAGAIATSLGAVQGRAAVTLDIAQLAGLACAMGIALGGRLKPVAKAIFDSDAPSAALRVVTPVIVPGDVASHDGESGDVPGAPAELHAVLAEMRRVEATLPAPKSGRNRRQPTRAGVAPPMLSAPRDGNADDLARIKGLGPKSLEKLHALGVFHYDQIAVWSLDNARWISAALEAPGRVERGKWVQQAQALANERRANVA
jgi:predicted flap endonuclease-1-like 5' DNA nuclease